MKTVPLETQLVKKDNYQKIQYEVVHIRLNLQSICNTTSSKLTAVGS